MPKDGRDAFAQVFCSALRADPEYGRDDCKKYRWLDNGFVHNGQPLPLLTDDWQVVVVAGIFSACLPRAAISIFKQGLEQLRREGLTTAEEIPVSATGGTEEHAQTIVDFMRSHQDPKRPFIAIGYSQGAADLLQAYVNDAVVRRSLAALITVAGAVGGSRLPDAIPDSVSRLLNGVNVHLPACDIKGLKGSMCCGAKIDTTSSQHRESLPRAYSIAGVSIEGPTADGSGGTSAILTGPWKALTAYSIDEDSQVLSDPSPAAPPPQRADRPHADCGRSGVLLEKPWSNERTWQLSSGELIEYSCEENHKSLWEGRIKIWIPPGASPVRKTGR